MPLTWFRDRGTKSTKAAPKPYFGETSFLARPDVPELRAIHAWWDTLCGDALMPEKALLSPHELRPFLPQIQVLEVVDGGVDYHVRLFGSLWVTLTGADFTGRRLSQIDNKPAEAKWHEIYSRCVAAKSPVPLKTNLNNVGKAFLRVEVLLMPFTQTGFDVDFVVAAIARKS